MVRRKAVKNYDPMRKHHSLTVSRLVFVDKDRTTVHETGDRYLHLKWSSCRIRQTGASFVTV